MLASIACTRAPVSSSESSSPSLPTSASPIPSNSAPLSSSAAAFPAPTAADPPAPSPSASAAPIPPPDPLLSETGAPLPQTEARPSAASEAFHQKLTLLVEAIASDAPSHALPAFFPVVAYEQVKAIERPERDWKQRLIGAFERDIHEYHRALGKDASHATFRGVEVSEAAVKWMKPGKEGNRVGYFRVLRSKLRVGLPDDRERALEITSLISWRGEWYVVHLSGFD